MKKSYIKISIVIFLFFMNIEMTAQTTPPAPNQRPGPGLPIDAGVVALLAAGVIYGVKKIKKN